jgi:hypothetical protein
VTIEIGSTFYLDKDGGEFLAILLGKSLGIFLPFRVIRAFYIRAFSAIPSDAKIGVV